jgi:2-polyprenyl-3-methyl-5-hydroxy-6-metoxy-1,4-benzoquinol methylase
MNKYFHHTLNRPIDLNKDGCDIKEWEHLFGTFLFAKHPSNFPVFLSPDELISSNEYAESDPYSVEENINSDFHRRRIECTLELIKKAVSNRKGYIKILDLGCGQGHITKAIRETFPQSEVSGLDYSVSAIEYAVDHFSGIDFAVGNAYDCPYSINYFDVIICNNLWEHVPDPLHLLAKITTVLKDDGSVIISTPSRYRVSNLLNVLRGKPVTFISKYHVTEYTVGQVIEQFKYGGFIISDVFSKPIKMWSIKAQIVKTFFSVLVTMVGSHHQLESTVFYLARRNRNKGGLND